MKRNDFDFSSRRRFTLAQRSRLIARYQRSGLTQRAFVQQHGLSLTSLTKGLRQDRHNQAAVPTGKVLPEFQPVDLSRRLGPPGWAAEVALPDGSTLRLAAHASATLADQLLQTLRRPC